MSSQHPSDLASALQQQQQQQQPVDVQPLHASDSHNLQRHLLHQKVFEARTSFASPTDNLLSPCTAKLQAHKKRHYVKSKPQLLRFGNLTAAANKENASESSGLGL
ncbi:Spo12 family protein [Lipomyces tetrasporus]